MSLRDAAQQALEVLIDAQRHHYALKHKETDDLVATLRAALAESETQSTHSADCYKWHHKCAIAEVERLTELHTLYQDKTERLKAERDAAVLRAERAESDLAKTAWRVFPFVHVRMDASESYKETALRKKLIELGWTPPTDAAINAAKEDK